RAIRQPLPEAPPGTGERMASTRRHVATIDAGSIPMATAPCVKVLAFDIFGTVVDWHGTIAREVAALDPNIDANAFALAWRAGYRPAMQRVVSGELAWTRIDRLHRLTLDQILPDFGLAHLDEAQRCHLNKVWHRLDAWP